MEKREGKITGECCILEAKRKLIAPLYWALTRGTLYWALYTGTYGPDNVSLNPHKMSMRYYCLHFIHEKNRLKLEDCEA